MYIKPGIDTIQRLEFSNMDACGIVKKGWGQETWIVNNEDFCAKYLDFNTGKQISFHFHFLKRELFLVVSGAFIFQYKDLSTGKDKERNIKTGDIIYIPRGQPHKLTALEESRILEVSTKHFDEDSYRISPGDSQSK